MNGAELTVWGLWHTEKNVWIGGLHPDQPIWSFSYDELEPYLSPPQSSYMEIREMSEVDIAKIPEATAAVVALFDMWAARERLFAARMQKLAFSRRRS